MNVTAKNHRDLGIIFNLCATSSFAPITMAQPSRVGSLVQIINNFEPTPAAQESGIEKVNILLFGGFGTGA